MSKRDPIVSVQHGDKPALSWFAELLESTDLPREGQAITAHGKTSTIRGGILRAHETGHFSAAQQQTSDAFGFKWAKRETFEGEPLNYLRQWLLEQYGNVATAPWLFATSDEPVMLDAGCGAAM